MSVDWTAQAVGFRFVSNHLRNLPHGSSQPCRCHPQDDEPLDTEATARAWLTEWDGADAERRSEMAAATLTDELRAEIRRQRPKATS